MTDDNKKWLEEVRGRMAFGEWVETRSWAGQVYETLTDDTRQLLNTDIPRLLDLVEQQAAEIERLKKERSSVFDVAFNQLETGVVFHKDVGDYLCRVLLHLQAERDKLCAEIERRDQLLACNDERIDLIRRKLVDGLNSEQEARLAALQENVAAIFPRVTPDMLRGLMAGRDKLQQRVQELEAELEQTCTEGYWCSDTHPDNDAIWCPGCVARAKARGEWLATSALEGK